MSKSQPVGGSDGKVHTSPLVTKFSPKLPKIPCVYVWILIWNKALSIVRMVTSQIYSSIQPASSSHPRPQLSQSQLGPGISRMAFISSVEKYLILDTKSPHGVALIIYKSYLYLNFELNHSFCNGEYYV